MALIAVELFQFFFQINLIEIEKSFSFESFFEKFSFEFWIKKIAEISRR